MRNVLHGFVFTAGISMSASISAAQQIEGLQGDASDALQAEIAQSSFLEPIFVEMFYGDLSGNGSNDAVALIYHPSEGNSTYLDSWLLRETDGSYEIVRDSPLKEVIGLDARDATFGPGRFAVTMTVLNPGDPRCCPTGERRFEIMFDGIKSVAPAPHASSHSGRGAWISTQVGAGVEVAAAALDGRSRIIGGCAAGYAPVPAH